MATTIPIACIDVDLGQEVLLSVPCRSDPVGPLRHSYCLYHAIHRLRPAQRHTPYVTHVSTEVWPYPRCEVVSSEQGANRVLHLLLEYLIDLLLQLLPHRFQGLLFLLVQFFLYRLERLIDLLVQLLSDGLEFLLHLLPHTLRHLLLEVFQDRLEGLRNLLLQRRAQDLPDACRLSCLLCLLLCLGRHFRLLAARPRCSAFFIDFASFVPGEPLLMRYHCAVRQRAAHPGVAAGRPTPLPRAPAMLPPSPPLCRAARSRWCQDSL